jgi:hypothetical protein
LWRRRITDMPPVEGSDDGHGFGVYGESSGILSGYGVWGTSPTGRGVYGESSGGFGVYGESKYDGDGVHGYSGHGRGVYGESDRGNGVYGESKNGYGVAGFSTESVGVYAHSYSDKSYAAYLDGKVIITGTLEKAGGSFKIDHPLDPANKYLCHSFVESPDMKNVYDGTVVLDDKGEAEIELPDWFAALNKDFRYQLTAIGAPGPDLYIATEISEVNTKYSKSSNNNKNSSRFKIAGGTSAMKVSWQVTGIRKDPWANAHQIQVEQDKPAKERGYYLHPELYGQSEEKGISRLLFP